MIRRLRFRLPTGQQHSFVEIDRDVEASCINVTCPLGYYTRNQESNVVGFLYPLESHSDTDQDVIDAMYLHTDP